MKLAIISTRGIPNNYGGFEQFAEFLSVGLVKRGHEVTVYSPHFHAYKKNEYKGVKIKHIYSPENWMGSSFGSFFYDFSSLKDALKNEKFDIIYDAGYTSIAPAYIWFNVKKIKYPVFITNMDGLECKRTKYSKLVQKFIFWEERKAVEHSHFIVSDNLGIQDYYKEKYNKESKFLAYGANIYDNYDENILKEYDLKPYNYFLIIARLEPENNIQEIIQGYLASNQKALKPLIIVGKTNTPHGKYLLQTYQLKKSIRFIGGIYDFDKLNSLRHFSTTYFHGHSVGGTNPSLLEAMASGCFILAHNNKFNATVLKENAVYWSSFNDIIQQLDDMDNILFQYKEEYVTNNLIEIQTNYSWKKLIDEHEKYFFELLSHAECNNSKNISLL